MDELANPSALESALCRTEEEARRAVMDARELIGWGGVIADELLAEAHRRCNTIVDRVPRESSADHASMFLGLATFLVGCSEGPAMARLPSVGPAVKRAFDLWLELAFVEHVRASLTDGLWHASMSDGALKVGIEPPIRRSGLHLMSTFAQYFNAEEGVRAQLAAPPNPYPDQLVRLLLRTTGTELQFMADAAPGAWKNLYERLPFSAGGVRSFRSFCMMIGQLSSRSGLSWYAVDNLWHLWHRFANTYSLESMDLSEFRALLELFSLTPEEALEWGLQAPFIRLGEDYGHWFFSSHEMHPDLNYLALLVRRHTSAWNNTVGGSLGSVARQLGDQVQSVITSLLQPSGCEKGWAI